MKKVKIFFAAVAVCLIAGGAIAAKTTHLGDGNLNVCIGSPLKCELSSTQTTVNTGVPNTVPLNQLFTGGTIGTDCSSSTIGCNNTHPLAAFTAAAK